MNKKRLLILGFVALVFIGAIVLFSNMKRNLLWLNWKISLPPPNRTEIIYNYEFREGEDLEIWMYTLKKAEMIKTNKHFKKIEKEYVSDKISEYYLNLDNNEKELFDKTISLTTVLNANNYYSILTRENDYLILILDVSSNKLYYIHCNS